MYINNEDQNEEERPDAYIQALYSCTQMKRTEPDLDESTFNDMKDDEEEELSNKKQKQKDAQQPSLSNSTSSSNQVNSQIQSIVGSPSNVNISVRDESRSNNNNNNGVDNQPAIIEHPSSKITIQMSDIISAYDAFVIATFDLIFEGVKAPVDVDRIVGLCKQYAEDPDDVYAHEARQWTSSIGKGEMVLVPFSDEETRGLVRQAIQEYISRHDSRMFFRAMYDKEETERAESTKERIPDACVLAGVLCSTQRDKRPTDTEVKLEIMRQQLVKGDIAKIAIYGDNNWVSIVLSSYSDWLELMKRDQIGNKEWYIRVSHAAGKVGIKGFFRIMFAPFTPTRTNSKGIRGMIQAAIKARMANEPHASVGVNPENVISAGQIRKQKNVGAGYGFCIVQGKETADFLCGLVMSEKGPKKHVSDGKVSYKTGEFVDYNTCFEYARNPT